ncbi:hypothetical protein H0H93_008576, partial [Arthromyces matolae]
ITFTNLHALQTLSIIGGVIYAILFVSKKISESMTTTKEKYVILFPPIPLTNGVDFSLKNKGYTISREGVSVKTSKRFDRSDYVDATQRGFVKAYGAASFGKDGMGQDSDVKNRRKA